MDARTRTQETLYCEALGYAWGRKDAPSAARKALICDSLAFATFYAVYEEMTQHHRTIQEAYEYFHLLKLEEQKAYGTEWARLPYSPHAAPNRTNR